MSYYSDKSKKCDVSAAAHQRPPPISSLADGARESRSRGERVERAIRDVSLKDDISDIR